MDEAAEQVVRAALVRTRQEARLSIHRGVALIAVIPIVLIAALVVAFAVGGLGAFLSILLAGIYMLVGGIGGVAFIVGGLADHRRSTRELRGIDERRQLPAARVVVR
jgi:hypothetical protein